MPIEIIDSLYHHFSEIVAEIQRELNRYRSCDETSWIAPRCYARINWIYEEAFDIVLVTKDRYSRIFIRQDREADITYTPAIESTITQRFELSDFETVSKIEKIIHDYRLEAILCAQRGDSLMNLAPS